MKPYLDTEDTYYFNNKHTYYFNNNYELNKELIKAPKIITNLAELKAELEPNTNDNHLWKQCHE
jgi:hypothetical protein